MAGDSLTWCRDAQPSSRSASFNRACQLIAMAPRQSAIYLAPMYCMDIVQYVLKQHAQPTILVVCCTREAFLENLRAAIHYADRNPEEPLEDSNHLEDLHPLLVPTIHLLAISHTVNIAFTPTLTHLKAFLATYQATMPPSTVQPKHEKAGSNTSILALLDLIELHRDTTEYSAQGLSRTLAVAVEAAQRSRMQLVLAESKQPCENEMAHEGYTEPLDIWREQISLLNGSIKVGGDNRAWAGRTVEVKQVVERWCHYRQLDEETDAG